MKKQLLSVAFVCLGFLGMAQVQQMGTPLSWKSKVGMPKEAIIMTPVDNSAEAANEATRRANSFEKDMRYGKELIVDINFMTQAEVTVLPNGNVLRQLKISSPGALSLNIAFNQFELSKNAILYLTDDKKTEFIGAHTSLNNNPNKALGTELIHSDAIIIELVEPADEAGTSTLNIGSVVHAYLDLEEEIKALGGSGSCEYDVNCPIGAGWENQRNAVAVLINSGGAFCSGSLINNASGTIIPYFLSANHCGTNPTSWIFRFRWERAAGNTICAASNNTSNNGPINMFVNGGTLKATCTASDFTLTLLNAAPDPAWGIYYNGFNATNVPATSAVGIHHPAGDLKKISFENQPLISTTFNGGVPDSHWGVTHWDNGVTEGGSSGSPLFDQNHRTVGQLHGGASSCGGSDLSDQYGKIYMSWTCGGTSASQLSNWLDPNSTGTTLVDGVDPSGPGITVDAGMGALLGVNGTQCSGTVTPSVTIINAGNDPLTSATVHYGYDGVFNQTYSWSGSLNQYQNQVVALPSATLSGGTHVFNAYISNPNASADQNNNNDTIESDFIAVVNPFTVALSLTTDTYGSETTWSVTSTDNMLTYFTGGPYTDITNGADYTASFCLAQGCYHFTINDEYGDGLTSNNSPNGHYELVSDNDTIGQLTAANANFGTTNTITFCVGTNGIEELSNLQESWSMYPNPASSVLEFGFANDNMNKEITIITAQGAIVRTTSTTGISSNMDVSNLSAGIYFVNVKNALGNSTKQLVIK